MNEDKTQENPRVEVTTNVNDFNDEPKRPIWITILAVAGILAVIVALGLGIFQLANRGSQGLSNITSGFGSIFRGEENIILSVKDSTISSNRDTILSLEHRNRRGDVEGDYTILFECEPGISVRLNGEDVTCDEEVALNDVDLKNIEVGVTSTQNRYTDLSIIARFENETVALETDTLLTIVNTTVSSEQGSTTPDEDEDEEAAEETPSEDRAENEDSKTTSTPEYVTVKHYVGRYSDPNGTADLKVVVRAVGIDRNGSFRERDRFSRGERAAVSFTVSNEGTKETGAWYFAATLPTGEPHYYKSDTQRTLLPGDRIEYVLSFDDVAGRGITDLFIHADPVNNIKELSDINNVAKAEFNVR